VANPSITLVGDDQSLARELLPHLNKLAGRQIELRSFAAALDQPEPAGHGLFLLGSASAGQSDQVVALVRTASLQKWPASLVVIETDSARVAKDLAILDPFLARRLLWPEEASALAETLKGWPRPRRVSAEALLPQGTPPEPIRRTLQATPSVWPLLQHILIAASHDVTVLLTGETGTGKTYLARLIHEGSPRRDQPFVPIPCGALSASLIGSELFGHIKGAFTGADRDKVGRLAAARAGTVLLDEVDTLGLEQQANLLRVVETGEFEPVGSTETQLCAARLIVASNVDLETEVKQGRFREDLWYRLNVLAIHLLPLRERPGDIAPLTRRLAVRFAHKFRKNIFDVAAEALAALERYPWPGNIRQLENVVQQAVLMCKGPQLLKTDLPEAIQQAAGICSISVPVRAADRPACFAASLGRGSSLEQTLAHEERGAIEQALIANGYSRSRTAAALGVSRVTLYKKLRKHGLMNRQRRPAG
jgi:DNA-binding NtrC family response regulator